jgi:hypothetical protein
MQRFHLLTLGAVVLMAGACGSDKSTGPGDGGDNTQAAFQATVTGDMAGDIQGGASFAEYQDQQVGQVFELGFSEQGGTGRIVLARNGGRPGNGSHTIADVSNGGDPAAGEFVAVVYDGDPGNPDAVFVSTGGSVSVSSSSSKVVKGTFQFDCVGFTADDPNTPVNLTVSGTFTAKPGAPIGGIASMSVERMR